MARQDERLARLPLPCLFFISFSDHLVLPGVYGFARTFVEDEQIVAYDLMEIEHGADRIRKCIE